MTESVATKQAAPEWDIADRMRKSLRESGMGVREMADYLGVSRNTVSTWINGRHPASKQTLILWSLRTGVRLPWLLDGALDSAADGADEDSRGVVRRRGLEPRTR